MTKRRERYVQNVSERYAAKHERCKRMIGPWNAQLASVVRRYAAPVDRDQRVMPACRSELASVVRRHLQRVASLS